MNNRLLAITRNVIPYVKELRELKYVNSVAASILMQQLEYWFDKYPDGFYKFTEPCNHEAYKEGDSWCEELGFSRSEFTTAFNGLGMKYKSKTEHDAAQKDKFQGKYYMAYTDRKKGLTYYYRNHSVVDKALNDLVTKCGCITKEDSVTERENVEIRNATKLNYTSEQSDVTEPNNLKFDLYTETTAENNPESNSETRSETTPRPIRTGGREKNCSFKNLGEEEAQESKSVEAEVIDDFPSTEQHFGYGKTFRNSPTGEKAGAGVKSDEGYLLPEEDLMSFYEAVKAYLLVVNSPSDMTDGRADSIAGAITQRVEDGTPNIRDKKLVKDYKDGVLSCYTVEGLDHQKYKEEKWLRKLNLKGENDGEVSYL